MDVQITNFGKEVKKRLIDLDRKQTWLIQNVRERTGLYFDDSYLSKILTGKLATPGIVQAIREILDLPEVMEEGCLARESLRKPAYNRYFEI